MVHAFLQIAHSRKGAVWSTRPISEYLVLMWWTAPLQRHPDAKLRCRFMNRQCPLVAEGVEKVGALDICEIMIQIPQAE
jgi:hypothetical protein